MRRPILAALFGATANAGSLVGGGAAVLDLESFPSLVVPYVAVVLVSAVALLVGLAAGIQLLLLRAAPVRGVV